MRFTARLRLLSLLAAVVPAGSAAGDAIVVTKASTASTIAEIFIDADSIRVELEIGLRDLGAFRNILPDELYQRLAGDDKSTSERTREFFTGDWTLRPDGGEPLVGEVKRLAARRRVRRDEITGEPLPTGDDEGELVVFVELAYQLAARPTTLTIKTPAAKDGGFPFANVGFVVYHGGLPVIDFRYLGGEETLELDWDDPWYSRFRNPNLRRQYDAPMSAFLYVEPFEVRKEIVVRPKDLEHWIELGLAGKTIIAANEQAELKRRVAAFLQTRNGVTIDGRDVEPILDRVDFIRRTLRKTGVIDPPEDLDVNAATLGVIFVYPTERLPQEVTMTWDMFGPKMPQVPTVATDEAGGMPLRVSPDDPVLRWQNFLTNPTTPAMIRVAPPPAAARIRLPLISGLCAGLLAVLFVVGLRRMRVNGGAPWGLVGAGAAMILCGLVFLPYARAELAIPFAEPPKISQQEARDVLFGLLNNIYRAFDRREESLVYDRLARSISGDLLSEVYLQTRRSTELENQGGARVKVKQVELLEATPEAAGDGLRFVYRCRWNVSGSVGHWGHTHLRTNQYEAVFRVEPVDGAWKITDMDLREEKRIVGNTLQ